MLPHPPIFTVILAMGLIPEFVGCSMPSGDVYVAEPATKPEVIPGKPAVADEPILALWREDPGLTPDVRGSSLRFAIWENGRMVYAIDSSKWGTELIEGELSEQQVSDIKKQINDSRATSLARRTYLVPDAPWYLLTAVIDGKKYVLEWDEVELPNYGIMGHCGPDERAFVECWHSLNRAGVATRPTQSSPSKFQGSSTQSWR